MIKVNLTTGECVRASLPENIKGLSPESLRDLSFVDESEGLKGVGYWENEWDVTPAYDPTTHVLDGTETLVPDFENYVVLVTKGIREKTADELAAELGDAKVQKLKELASYRFDKETGGIEVNGSIIKTDRDSQATLTGAYVAVQQNPAMLIDWKSANGWIKIDKATVESLCMAVTAHIQSCFSRERELAKQVSLMTNLSDVVAFDAEVSW